MKRLSDGVYALVSRPPFESEVCSFDGMREVIVPPEQLDELMALSHGVPDDTPSGPLYRKLAVIGMAADGLPAVDEAAFNKLAALGRGYAWRLSDWPRAGAWVDLLRAAHVQRKITYLDYGQTPVVPECGVRRCLEMTERLGKRKKVLVIGDDDLLSLALARMGHKVTVLEIDTALVAFVQRIADREGLSLTLHSQDVRDPLPPSWVGTFDAVLTDPMSYEPCLMAFLVRAASALRVGGQVYCCLHPYARDVLHRVVTQLPLGLVDHLAGFNVYHYEGFDESWYRSDLLVLERTAGATPFRADERIPFTDLIDGAHAGHWHGFTRLRAGPFRKPQPHRLKECVMVWAEKAYRPVSAAHEFATATHAHLYLAFSDGGHLAVSTDLRRGVVTYAIYPFLAPHDALLSTMIAEVFGMPAPDTFRCEVPPLDAPTLRPGAPAFRR